MLRKISLSVAILAALTLSGCDDTRGSKPSEAGWPAAAAEAADPVAALNQLKGFNVGKGASAVSMPTAYVLFDPQCPHCAHLWNEAKPLESKVLIKWIPVGWLNGMSATQGAMLLEAADPVALMSANEAVMLRTGRPSTDTAAVKDETLAHVKANTAMLATLKVTSVPTIIYRDPATKNLEIVSGARPTAELEKMFGIADGAAGAK